MIRTRFAPSPNGALHLGHALAAVTAHDLARSAQGEFLLRIEDIDGTRSRADLVSEILSDLSWLGLRWDGDVVFQSRRLTSYAAAAQHLRELGLLYPCQCTRAEIRAAGPAMGPDGPVYPGTCRGQQIDPHGEVAWRLDMAKALQHAGPLRWYDQLAGWQDCDPIAFGDVVLVRKEAPASYHLAATIDDARDGITLVTRGYDLFQASHVHRLLQALLGLPVPEWHHHPLIVEADGRKLAKRRGSPGLAELRRAGHDGHQLAQDLRDGRLPAGLSLGMGVEVTI